MTGASAVLVRMADRIEITRDIAASPEAVYDAISDVTRMGEWSEECHACEWHDGVEPGAVGAVFTGHNRAGDKEWSTQATVVAADRPSTFTFDCSTNGFHYATWGYTIEATDGGSRVTEWTENYIPEEFKAAGAQVSGIADRDGRNRQTMSGTLERLAAALEA